MKEIGCPPDALKDQNIETQNGPAFPQILAVRPDGYFYTPSDIQHGGGMSLRDYMAAKAMQGLLANGIEKTAKHGLASGYDNMNAYQILSRMSYKAADAMLEARKK